MADISPGSWTEFLCLEAANSGVDAIVLAPQQTHTMQALIAVQAL